jgi:hypothetical protein
MTVLFATLFVLSAAGNGLLVWYVRKLIKNLNNGVKGVDDLQELLEEYTGLLEGMLQLDQYYGDDTISGAVKNTKLVIEACKFYKKSVLDIDEANIEQPDQNR